MAFAGPVQGTLQTHGLCSDRRINSSPCSGGAPFPPPDGGSLLRSLKEGAGLTFCEGI